MQSTRGRHGPFPCHLLLAVLGLFGQLALGASVHPAGRSAVATATVAALGPICRAGYGADDPSAPGHSMPCLELCLLTAALDVPAAVLAAVPGIPLPEATPVPLRFAWASARAPPAAVRLAAYPRGPPTVG